MMKQIINKNKYAAFTLVETLITLVIVAIVLIVVSQTLVALIKASNIASARSLSRSESEFVLELLEKEISNSESDDIKLYKFAPDDIVVDSDGNVQYKSLGTYLDIDLESNIGQEATQIVMHPIGSEDFVCISLVWGVDDEGDRVGYIMKNTVERDRPNCLVHEDLNDDYPVFLTSEEVNVSSFDIEFIPSGENNHTFLIDLTLIPIRWIPGEQSRYKPEYIRQLIVSTEKLTF